MSSDYEKGVRKTLDLSVKTKDFTVDTLKDVMRDFLSGKAKRKGKVTVRKLSENAGKLENVDIANINDFLKVAKRYDIDFAVKKESGGDKYHVFFQASNTDDFKRAFTEFAVRKQDELVKPRGEITRQQMKEQAKEISQQPKKKEKLREKSKDMSI
jgi:hypothetical protein